MRKAQDIEPADSVEARLRGYDLREHDNPDSCDAFRLKYLARLEAALAAVRAAVPAGGRVLEVGCSQANLSAHLAEAGYRVVATDVLLPALRYARKKQPAGGWALVASDARYPSFREGMFDALVVGELLEHLPRPGETLARLVRLLCAGGTVVITVPNGRFFRHRLLRYEGDLDGRAADTVTGPEGSDHVFDFDRGALAALAREAGVDVLKVQLVGSAVMSPRARWVKTALGARAIELLSRMVSGLPGLGERMSYTLVLVGRRQ